MNEKLKVAAELALPLDAVTQRMAFMGRTGSGKTYGAGKVAEQMLYAGAQVVILDPVGPWYGLRLAADGKNPGIPIPVFGGLHGDIPLEVGAGAYIADLIVDKRLSVILDVSQFDTEADKAKFATAWATRFFNRQKAKPSAVHLFIEECQEFVPQNPQKGEEHMLHAFNRIWKVGRNFGIGGSLISQRPQEINKKSFNLTECMFAFQMTGPHERKTMRDWMSEKGIDDNLDEILRKLEIGRARIWSPVWLKVSGTYKIDKKATFDASSTPEVGKAAHARELAPIDLERIRVEMQETIEKAKADDPKELHKRIAELQRELAKKPGLSAAPPEVRVEEKLVELPVVTEQQAKDFLAATSILDGAIRSVSDEMASIRSALVDLQLRQQQIKDSFANSAARRIAPAKELRMAPRVSAPATAARAVTVSGSDSIPAGEKKILIVCAQYPDGVDKTQMSILTGFKRSTRDRYIQYLRQKGYVGEDRGMVLATQEGLDALGNDYEPLPTGEELQSYWLDRLPDGERKILQVLLDASGNPVRRETIDAHTGFKRSTRDRYLQYLAARKLVEMVGAGEVCAAALLFEESSR